MGIFDFIFEGDEEEKDPGQKELEEFRAEVDKLKALYGRRWAMPEPTEEERACSSLYALDMFLKEDLSMMAERNLRIIETYCKEVDRGSLEPHRAMERINSETRDIGRIYQDMLAYRNERSAKYVAIERQLRSGEIDEIGAWGSREELSQEDRKKGTRFGLVSAGMDWPDIGDMMDDFYNLVPDAVYPDYEEKRKSLRERFAALPPEGKRQMLDRIREDAEESGDHTTESFFDLHIRGAMKSEY